MLILAALQASDALYTNESIRFNNRSPIWHRGPSSQFYPGREAHSCFQTEAHCEPPGPWINCPSPVRSGLPFLTKRLLPPHLHLFTETHLLPNQRWNLPEEQLIARLGFSLFEFFSFFNAWAMIVVSGGISVILPH